MTVTGPFGPAKGSPSAWKVVPPPRRWLNHDVAAPIAARKLLYRRQSKPGAAEALRDRDIGLRKTGGTGA